MAIYKLIKSFSLAKYTDAEVIVVAQDIVKQMTDNVHFVTPLPSLVDVTKAIDDFAASLVTAKNGSREDTVIKNNLRSELERKLKMLADYVENSSNNDLAMLTSSGFALRKKSESIGTLPAPTNIEIKAGKAHGSLVISWDVVKNTYLYVVEYAEGSVTDTTVWQRLTSSKSNVVIPNLKRGGLYVIRVAAAATDNTLIWSEEVSSYVM